MTKLSMSEEEMLKRKYTRPYEKRIAELEKENAELKEKLNFSTQYYQGEKAKEQLTKAKELLKEFVHHYKDKTIYIENMQDLLEQVERFIKNSEVEK